MSNFDLKTLALPKWPQHLVTGVPVTVEQAKEIIRRTDIFFVLGYGGNNRDYDRRVRVALGMPEIWNDIHDRHSDGLLNGEEYRLALEKNSSHGDLFQSRWGTISTAYVHNNWISSCFVGGPSGWCHPDGQIGFVDNVGKWPSIADIEQDWGILAREFPFLDIGVTLFDGEQGEQRSPVVSMRVRNGAVTLVDPNETDVHAGHPPACRRAGAPDDPVAFLIANSGNLSREQGLPDEWIREWARNNRRVKPEDYWVNFSAQIV